MSLLLYVQLLRGYWYAVSFLKIYLCITTHTIPGRERYDNANKIDERLLNKCNIFLLCFRLFLISSSNRHYRDYKAFYLHEIIVYLDKNSKWNAL